MTEKYLKYIFLTASSILLIGMLLMSRKAGVTCDEVLHYNHSVSVYNYFATLGEDKSSIDTPVSHLQYYGQSYDNIVTILTEWLGIRDIYGFRNLMSTLAGWVAIMLTAFFAIWIEGYGAGLLVVILLALSPVFIGHSQNNLKDIPFALGYIASLFYMLKLLTSSKGFSRKNGIILVLSMAFCLSIRAGGLVLICYLFFFFIIINGLKLLRERKFDLRITGKQFFILTIISIIAVFLSTILWPYALQNPFTNIYRSYEVMAQYPDTFRQIFNGKVEWSDFMPWYYIPEFMMVTIPVIVLLGLILFLIFYKKTFPAWKSFVYGALIFSIIFPVLFVIWKKSNVYSAWRQFLFIYPGLVIISAIGFLHLFRQVKSKYLLWSLIILFSVLSVDPLRFMIFNPQYSYIYYNQLVGGIKGAYGRFEMDYYYVSLKEGSEWLKNYLDHNKKNQQVRVMANFSVQWFFRDHPEIKNGYMRFEERSMQDWDYAIITTRYIPPIKIIDKTWPPSDAIKVIYADEVPVCAVLERKSKDDYLGYKALEEGKPDEAIAFFRSALNKDDKDEMIYYNFASALMDTGQHEKADSVLKKCLELNPDFDLALMYLGNIALSENRTEDASVYYERLIKANRRYLDAYVGLSKLVVEKDVGRARKLLMSCLELDPQFKPAVIALADTYRKYDPEIAGRYDELARTLK
jgi:hypothetical protein